MLKSQETAGLSKKHQDPRSLANLSGTWWKECYQEEQYKLKIYQNAIVAEANTIRIFIIRLQQITDMLWNVSGYVGRVSLSVCASVFYLHHPVWHDA